VLGVGYYLIWRGDLWRNRDLVAIGTLYKLAYTGVGPLYRHHRRGAPCSVSLGIRGPDAVFFVLMAECLVYLYRHRADFANDPKKAVPVGRQRLKAPLPTQPARRRRPRVRRGPR
jgi:hypothetical protein